MTNGIRERGSNVRWKSLCFKVKEEKGNIFKWEIIISLKEIKF